MASCGWDVGSVAVVRKKADGERRLCADCNPNSRRRGLHDASRPEMKVNTYLANCFPSTYPIGTYAPFRLCGDLKRPNTVITIGDMMVFVEIEEHHEWYELTCEWSKIQGHGQSALQTDTVVSAVSAACA